VRELATGVSDCESHSEDKVEVHPLTQAVPSAAPSTGASDHGRNSADEVKIHRDPALPAVLPVAPVAQPAAPLGGVQKSPQTVAYQPTLPTSGGRCELPGTHIHDAQVQL
jgi:hypothetical protein